MGAWLLLLVLISLGFALARAFWPAPWRWSAADPLRLAAAPALGLGAASGIYFALRIVLRQPPIAVIGAVVAAAVILGGVAWRRAQTAEPDAAAPAAVAPRWIWILACAGAAMAFLTYLMLHAAAPHGEWDAWSIWNLRARFLFRAQEFVSPFSNVIEWSHPDYPLLLPGVVALLWHAGGAESTAITGAVNLLFLISAVAVPAVVVWLLRGPGLGALCALVVLGATGMVRISASLYADVPLAAFIVIAGSLAVYALETPGAGIGPLLLAGLAAGFGAWTKNEGLLFCVSLLAAHLLSVSAPAEIGRRVRTLVPLLVGVAVVLALAGHFKVRIAPQNDLVNASNLALFSAKMSDSGRFLTTFLAFAGALLLPLGGFAVWLALVRFRVGLSGATILPLVAGTLQLIGYFLVYLGTSKDLVWQLDTSLPRLLLHVWPLAVAGIFLISRDIFSLAAQPSPPVTRSR